MEYLSVMSSLYELADVTKLPTLATIDPDAARNFVKAITSRVARAAAADYDGKLHSDVNRHALAKALRGYLAFQATFVIDEEETEEDPKKK